MTEAVGLSIGATNLGAVIPRNAAATRESVLTLFRHRPAEVGTPEQNPNLDQQGLVISGFVERVGDPVGIVAVDGSVHRAEALLADALCALMYTATQGLPPAEPATVTFPAHWRRAQIEALRRALAALPEWSGGRYPLVSDASAALTALQKDPGLPTRGVVALCDFGGTGTSITLADAGNGFRPIGPTVRHTDFSGDLIDHAVLTHVVADLANAGAVDMSQTSAIDSLTRLRTQCRQAKERLSDATVTTLVADMPGFRDPIRLTRAELDAAMGRPLDEFVAVVLDTLRRNGVHPADLAAVATAGGGANIPAVTTALSQHLRVPVITTSRPDLIAATGAALWVAGGPAAENPTVAAPTLAAAALPDPEPQSTGFPALAWSQEDEATPEPAVVPIADARPQLQFVPDEWQSLAPSAARVAWYRRPLAAAATGLVLISLGAGAIVLRNDSSPLPAKTTTTVTPTPAPSAASPASQNPGQAGAPQMVIQQPVPVAQSNPMDPAAANVAPPAPQVVPGIPMPAPVGAPLGAPIVAPAPPIAAPPIDPPPPAAPPPTTQPTTTPPVVTTTQTPTTTQAPPPTTTTTQTPTTTQAPPTTHTTPPTTHTTQAPSSEPQAPATSSTPTTTTRPRH